MKRLSILRGAVLTLAALTARAGTLAIVGGTLIDGNGNIGQLTLVSSGGKSELDQDILFSARQAAYPFPPKNASVADRTFLVTYVYK